MLKLPKGLKKKKKGKKSKRKEDELFDSAELEEYRRQQQQKQKEAGEGEQEGEPVQHEESEEWLKFKALTSGVDDILKKTQGDLDRIKSTSYFQKKPPGSSEPKKETKPVKPELPPPAKSKWVGFEEGAGKDDDEKPIEEKPPEPPKEEQVEEQVEEEEEESEFDDDQDDIFDTSYVDVVASGEVKLAYVPDSPIEELAGPDPFDTSIVDKVIKLDPKEQKRSLISLGCAVEVLTGKLDKSPCREVPSSTPRKRPKAQDLLLGSFDEGDAKFVIEGEPEPPPKSILDDDPIFEEETSAVLGLPPVTPIAEVKSICTPVKEEKPKEKDLSLKELVEEFVPLRQTTVSDIQITAEEDDLDDEFAALAVESLSKKPPPPPRPQAPTPNQIEDDDVFLDDDDPFDTTFATQVLPGKFELKLIEKEILNDDIPIKIDSVEEKINGVLKNSELSVQVSKGNNQAHFENELEPLSLKHRDLLGGSTTDLTKIDQPPIAPKSVNDATEFDLADPFDTSIAEVFVVPGKTELKVLEKELLDQSKSTVQIDVDEDFDPRAEEIRSKPPTRPDNLSVVSRTSIPKVVAFDVEFPKDETDLLAVCQEENSKVGKPLTPYYPPKPIEDTKSFEEDADPFDTSYVSNCPGKVELKILEQELAFEEKRTLKTSISDPDFDPRGAEDILKEKKIDCPDILTGESVVDAKLHTPVAPKKFIEEPESTDNFDPFDTSIANTLIPGKAEIKILETELIHKEAPPIPTPNTTILEKLKRDSESFSSLLKASITDVLELPHEDTSVKPLTPLAASSSFDQDNIDPFDTSGVGDILPEVGTTQLPQSNNSFNPFLAGNDLGSSNNDNPFMSTFSESQNVFDSSNATNPFAIGSESDGANVDFFSTPQNAAEEQNTFNYENIFSQPDPVQAQATQPVVDLFGDEPSNNKDNFAQEDLLTSTEQSNNIFSSGYDSGFDDSGKGPPRRPPPPRPGGPPKETKDLILSVTGAMEATSSHLLDRLQATRTPSPTPMRDLHSPSPTQFGDLLEVDEPSGITGPVSQQQEPQEVNFLGDDFEFERSSQDQLHTQDTTKRSSISEGTITPITPVPLSNESEKVQTVTPIPKPAAPPSRPAPPSIPERPRIPPQPPRPPVPSRPKTPEITPSITPQQIVSPPQQKGADELGFDDVFGEVIPNTMAPLAIPTTAVTSSATPLITANVTASEQSLLNSDLTQIAEPSAEADVAPPTGASVPPLTATMPPTTPPAPPPSADPVHMADTFYAMKGDFFDKDLSNIQNETINQAQNNLFELSQESATSGEQQSMSLANESAFSQLDFPTGSAPPAQSFNIFDAFNSGTQLPKEAKQDDFDAFAAKFENAAISDVPVQKADPFDPFSSGFQSAGPAAGENLGFGADDNFDSFLSLREPPPVPQGTPARISRGESAESNDDNDFNIFIKPKSGDEKSATSENLPSLAPPPKSPTGANAFQDGSPRFNPFDNTQEVSFAATENIFAQAIVNEESRVTRTDSQETPPTPLFDEDVSQPLEDFPRIHFDGSLGWEMQLRQPNKKKITGQRFWKKIFIKLVCQGENPVLQLFNSKDDKDPFQELPLQPCYSVSEIGAQQYDQYGKIFTVKLQFIFYKERPGVRPGQVTKAERITNKLSQFAAYAIQGDYQGVKEFGSDLKKLGLPVEHAPQISQLFKIGSQTYEDMKQFSTCVEEALFRLSAHRDRALSYKMEEVQITAVDELYVEQNANGGVDKQIARVRLFFLGFLSGMPDVELGVNDLVRQGKEVVGRHDIIPVVTEEWIRLESVEFHACVQQDEYEKTRTIRFKPPDASYIELMRFRIRPPKNRELPLQLKVVFCVTGNKVEIHGDILVPGFTSRKLGQIPCEDVMVRIPIPECWIYQFRVEKHFRYGSVKSAHRRTGKVKGIERFLGAVENMEPSLMEATSGVAKYEHQHRSIVWRMPRLPKEGQGAYTTHNLIVRLQLTSFDQIPEELAKYAYVEFTMPATTVSHTTVRSVSIQNSDSDAPPEKYVRQLSRHEYRVEVQHTHGEGPADYIAATITKPAPITEEPKPVQPPPPESDSDSDSG